MDGIPAGPDDSVVMLGEDQARRALEDRFRLEDLGLCQVELIEHQPHPRASPARRDHLPAPGMGRHPLVGHHLLHLDPGRHPALSCARPGSGDSRAHRRSAAARGSRLDRKVVVVFWGTGRPTSSPVSVWPFRLSRTSGWPRALPGTGSPRSWDRGRAEEHRLAQHPLNHVEQTLRGLPVEAVVRKLPMSATKATAARCDAAASAHRCARSLSGCRKARARSRRRAAMSRDRVRPRPGSRRPPPPAGGTPRCHRRRCPIPSTRRVESPSTPRRDR